MDWGVVGFALGHACELGFSSGLENLLQNIYGVHPLERDPKNQSNPGPPGPRAPFPPIHLE